MAAATPTRTWGYPQTLMMYDIAALQQIYGANYNTNAANTIYSWNPTTGELSINNVGQGPPGNGDGITSASENRVLMTIWDGGGTDTYDLSALWRRDDDRSAPRRMVDDELDSACQPSRLRGRHRALPEATSPML